MSNPIVDKNDDRLITMSRDNKLDVKTETYIEGWGGFPPDLALFIADFSQNRLNPIEKIVFFSYYFTGMTMKSIGERLHTSHQRVDQVLRAIGRKIKYSWKYQDKWTDPIEEDYVSRSGR